MTPVEAKLRADLGLVISERDFWKARAEKAEAQVTALTSPVPGLAEDGPYTEADVDAIEAHRKKPYARLRATVRAVAAARALIEEKKR